MKTTAIVHRMSFLFILLFIVGTLDQYCQLSNSQFKYLGYNIVSIWFAMFLIMWHTAGAAK